MANLNIGLPPSLAKAQALGGSATKFRLKPKQYDFVYSPARYTFFVGGIGSGKTYSGAVKAILYIASHPHTLGLIAAPTYMMLRDVTLRTFFELAPEGLIQSYNKNTSSMIATNKAEVLFRSMDQPDRSRGTNMNWFWMDEAPLCGHYSWQVLKGRLRVKGSELKAWATGTPHGKDGFWSDFEHQPLPDHQLIRSSTWENRSNLADGYIEGLGYEGAFYEQEVLGKFTAFEGLVYNFGTEEADTPCHVWPVPKGKQFKRVYAGVDWGYTNPAVCLVFGLDGDDRLWQIGEYYQRHVTLDDFIKELIEMAQTYRVEEFYCDPAEPGHIHEFKKAVDNAMIPTEIRPANNSITDGIQSVKRWLQVRDDGLPSFLVSPTCVHTIAEYGAYQYPTRDASKRNADEKPLKQSDHAMDATRYVIHTALATIASRIPIAISHTTSKYTSQVSEEVLAAIEAQKTLEELERIDRMTERLRNFERRMGIPN